jgi:hypothetical protein
MSAIAPPGQEGWLCQKEKFCEATTVGTDGVVVQMFCLSSNNHPVRSLSMLRDFFSVAATPPVREGQWRSSQFIHRFTDRTCEENPEGEVREILNESSNG